MDSLREKPSQIIIILVIIMCLVLTVIPVVRMIRNAVNYVPPTPLSEIVLKGDDLAAGVFENDGISSDCNKYLAIQSPQTPEKLKSIDCYQVRFHNGDKSVILLNAIWFFDSLAEAESEINALIELQPVANNIEPKNLAVSTSIGDKRFGSTAIISGGSKPLYVTNLNWRKGESVVRLTVLSYQNPFPIEELIMPALRIEARLETRFSQEN